MEKQEGIYGGTGVIVKNGKYNPHVKIGWNGKHSNAIEEVDLVGHAWFFKQEWSKYLWYEKPIMLDNGEDIMFSYLAQKYGNIKTYVPPHPNNIPELWSTDFKFAMNVGCDENSSWKRRTHGNQRDEIVQHCIKNGWKTLNK